MPKKNNNQVFEFFIDAEDGSSFNLLNLRKDSGRKKSKLVKKPYNFCDYWCEKCLDKNQCDLYQYEKKLSPQDRQTSQEYFQITEKFLNRLKIQSKLAQSKTKAKNSLAREKKNLINIINNNECLYLTQNYIGALHFFLTKYFRNLARYKEELKIEFTQNDLGNNIETLEWYHVFIPIKLLEVVEHQAQKNFRNTKSFKQIINLVEEGFLKSRNALVNLGRMHENDLEEIAFLISKLQIALVSFREAFKLPQSYDIINVNLDEEIIEILKKDAEEHADLFPKILQKGFYYLLANYENKIIYDILGELYLNAGHAPKAIPFLELAARLNPLDYFTAFLLGTTLSRVGRFNQSIRVLRRAIELEPESDEAKRNLGFVMCIRANLCQDKREFLEGQHILKNLIAEDEEFLLAIVDLAHTYLLEDDFSSAASWLDKALALDPHSDFIKKIHKNLADMQIKYKLDHNFRKINKEKKNAIQKFYRLNKKGLTEFEEKEIDEQVSKYLEIENIISELNFVKPNEKNIKQILSKLDSIGVIGKIQKIKQDSREADAIMDYIEHHDLLSNKLSEAEIMRSDVEIKKLSKQLNHKSISLKKQKEIIIILARQESEVALRALEDFSKNKAKGDLKVWAQMAVDEVGGRLMMK